jgi:hypothetical protein
VARSGLKPCSERVTIGAWCELLDRRGTLDPDAVVASQEPVHEAGERLRSWCANPHLRKVAELERVELLRAQVTEELLRAQVTEERLQRLRSPSVARRSAILGV